MNAINEALTVVQRMSPEVIGELHHAFFGRLDPSRTRACLLIARRAVLDQLEAINVALDGEDDAALMREFG